MVKTAAQAGSRRMRRVARLPRAVTQAYWAITYTPMTQVPHRADDRAEPTLHGRAPPVPVAGQQVYGRGEQPLAGGDDHRVGHRNSEGRALTICSKSPCPRHSRLIN